VSDPVLQSNLRTWLERIRAGDESARDELLRASCGHLERLARKMLQQYPRVRRWEETGDVLQNALLRLFRALKTVRPDSARAFFGLAAEQIRRELLDLARHYYGPHGQGAHHDSVGPGDLAPPEATDQGEDPEELERWCRFHEEVERLPAEDREVVSLRFYHGWTESSIAELLKVNERTVRRRWGSAVQRLQEVLGGLMPEQLQ